MFTRREKSATPVEDHAYGSWAADDETAGGKGRPTPKRRDAERERRERIRPPRDSKAAARLNRERKLAERKAAREGMVRGDVHYLPPRDQGPVRKFVRDLVDSRLSAAEFFLPGALIILLLTIFGSEASSNIASLIWSVLVVAILIDSIFFLMRLRREMRRRFEDQPRRGAIPYALMRALTYRRMRTPKPQVARGTKV